MDPGSSDSSLRVNGVKIGGVNGVSSGGVGGFGGPGGAAETVHGLPPREVDDGGRFFVEDGMPPGGGLELPPPPGLPGLEFDG